MTEQVPKVETKISFTTPNGKPLDMDKELQRMQQPLQVALPIEHVWSFSLEPIPRMGLSCGFRQTSYGGELLVIPYFHILKLLNTIYSGITRDTLIHMFETATTLSGETFEDNPFKTIYDALESDPTATVEAFIQGMVEADEEVPTTLGAEASDKISQCNKRKEILNQFIRQPLVSYRPAAGTTRSVCVAFAQELNSYDPRIVCPSTSGGYKYLMCLFGMPSEKSIREWCERSKYPLWYRGMCRIVELTPKTDKPLYIPIVGVPYYIVHEIMYGHPERPLTQCEKIENGIDRCIDQNSGSCPTTSNQTP